MEKDLYTINDFSEFVSLVGSEVKPEGTLKETVYINTLNGSILSYENMKLNPEVSIKITDISDVTTFEKKLILSKFRTMKFEINEKKLNYNIEFPKERFIPIIVISIAAQRHDQHFIQNIWNLSYDTFNELISTIDGNKYTLADFLANKFIREKTENINSINITNQNINFVSKVKTC